MNFKTFFTPVDVIKNERFNQRFKKVGTYFRDI